MSAYISRRSLMKLAASLGAGVAGSRWVMPEALSAQSPDVSALKSPDTMVLLVPGFMAQLYETVSAFAMTGFDTQMRTSLKTVPVVGDALASSLPSLRVPLKAGAAVSFYSQERKLDALGIRYQNIAHISDSGFDTQQGVVANGKAIAAVITRLRSQNVKQVVIVTHSKGGLDTLEALTTNESLWKAPVVGWIALQAPFYGSPVAGPAAGSAMSQNAIVSGARRALSSAARLAQALNDLAPDSRKAYMDQRAPAIARLTAALPVRSCYTDYSAISANTLWTGATVAGNVISAVFSPSLLAQIAEQVASSEVRNVGNQAAVIKESLPEATHLVNKAVADALHDPLSNVGLMDPFNLAMLAGRSPNDGLVPVESTKLPGATVTELLPKADHAAPVMIAEPFKAFWTTAQRDDRTIQQAAGVSAGAG